MLVDFDACVKNGGKVITKQLSAHHYIHMCKDMNGKWYSGEEKTYKKVLKK